MSLATLGSIAPSGVVAVDPTVALYRRRRLGVGIFVATFVVALTLSFSATGRTGVADRSGDPASVAAVGPTRPSYTVQPGDTLWAIAERLYPGAPVAEVVALLVERNGGASIEVGQRLVLP